MAWLEAAFGAYMVGKYVYNGWTKEYPRPKWRLPERLDYPQIDEGATMPMLYGKCRVRSPLLVWYGNPEITTSLGDPMYMLSCLFVLGIPPRNGTVLLSNIWIGDQLTQITLVSSVGYPVSPNIYTGDDSATVRTVETVNTSEGTSDPSYVRFNLKFGGGSTTQEHGTVIENVMVADGNDATLIPDFRGYAIVGAIGFTSHSKSPPTISFEVTAHPAGFSTTNVINGADINPSYVIQDLLTGSFGKMGWSTSLLDTTSFAAAAVTLKEEGNGYSRCIDSEGSAESVITEILQQTDGVLRENMTTGKIEYKLIRGDYDPATIPHITPSNCDRIENFSAGLWTDTVNRVLVKFTNRAGGYTDGVALAENPANAVGQDGEVSELTLTYPGVCTAELARDIAARELAARSRPLTRCRVLVDRTMFRVSVGDPVRVTWPEYNLSQRVFRVVNVDRGTLQNGQIALDLFEDYFYVHRRHVQPGGPVTPFPVPDLPATAS